MEEIGGPEAYLIAVGDELLSGERLEHNAHEIQAMLMKSGIQARHCAMVRDDANRIAAEVRRAAGEADFVILTGGLGPTLDDLTRQGVAEAAGVSLIEDQSALQEIERFFKVRNRTLSESNRRQALIPAGAEMISNPIGTAPGFVIAIQGRPVFCLPGVPAEMRLLMEQAVLPRIGRAIGRQTANLVRSRIHLVGITESSVNDQISALSAIPGLRVGITVSNSVITIKLLAQGTGAQALVDKAKEQVHAIFGDRIIGEGDDRRIEQVVGRLLIERRITLALAESCTGGLVGHLMTSVPGISSVFLEGTVAYSPDAKMRTLGVTDDLLKRHGQVSSEVARAMASGAASRAGARAGIGITGIAGPGGGTAEKPVGTVHMAVCFDGAVKDKKYIFTGDREMIKMRSAVLALDLLRRTIIHSA